MLWLGSRTTLSHTIATGHPEKSGIAERYDDLPLTANFLLLWRQRIFGHRQALEDLAIREPAYCAANIALIPPPENCDAADAASRIHPLDLICEFLEFGDTALCFCDTTFRCGSIARSQFMSS
jgi:hypothetical protein